MQRWRACWIVVVAWLAIACQGPSSRAERGFSGNAGPVSPDGGVANGVAANPLAGAFFDDGSNDDIRARTENFFAKDDTTAGLQHTIDAQARSTTPSEQPARAERMLVHRGEVSVEVARPDEVAREFTAKVTAWGGFLLQQQGTTLTVRVPAKEFEAAFAAAKALGRLLGESRSANDVTEEFVDLGIRLDNARKSRERLLEILQKADKVEDILKVETELRRLTEEIERMEGRRKFLADQVAMATLTVALHANAPPPRPNQRRWSRFDWINRVGAETMVEDF